MDSKIWWRCSPLTYLSICIIRDYRPQHWSQACIRSLLMQLTSSSRSKEEFSEVRKNVTHSGHWCAKPVLYNVVTLQKLNPEIDNSGTKACYHVQGAVKMPVHMHNNVCTRVNAGVLKDKLLEAVEVRTTLPPRVPMFS